MLKGRRTCCFSSCSCSSTSLPLHSVLLLWLPHHTTIPEHTTSHLNARRSCQKGFYSSTNASSIRTSAQDAYHHASSLRSAAPRLRRQHLRPDLHSSGSSLSLSNPLAIHQRFRWRPLDRQAPDNVLSQRHCSRNTHPMPQRNLQHNLHRPG